MVQALDKVAERTVVMRPPDTSVCTGENRAGVADAGKILQLQRLAGNTAVVRLLRAEEPAGRDGGSPPAKLQRQPPQGSEAGDWQDGTRESPQTQLKPGSKYNNLDGGLLTVLRETLKARSIGWGFGFCTNLDDALDNFPAANVGTLIRLQRELQTLGLWSHVQKLTNVWTSSSLGLRFIGPPVGVSELEGNFCQDREIGQLYHPGRSCWRQRIRSGDAGMHVCLPDEFHIDPHQPVERETGYVDWGIVGSGALLGLFPPAIVPATILAISGVSTERKCIYDLTASAAHLSDIWLTKAKTVFDRINDLNGSLDRQRRRLDSLKASLPAVAAQEPKLSDLQNRAKTVDATLHDWAIEGAQPGATPKDPAPLMAEIDRIDSELTSVREAIDEAERVRDQEAGLDSSPPPLVP